MGRRLGYGAGGALAGGGAREIAVLGERSVALLDARSSGSLCEWSLGFAGTSSDEERLVQRQVSLAHGGDAATDEFFAGSPNRQSSSEWPRSGSSEPLFAPRSDALSELKLAGEQLGASVNAAAAHSQRAVSAAAQAVTQASQISQAAVCGPATASGASEPSSGAQQRSETMLEGFKGFSPDKTKARSVAAHCCGVK